jgi:DNA-binding CsgD family transcriptional regulator
MRTVVVGANIQTPVGRSLFDECTWQCLAGVLNLSPRELDITRGIFDDKTTESIASMLNISAHTVHAHQVRLYHKLNVSSRVELVMRVFVAYLAQRELLSG